MDFVGACRPTWASTQYVRFVGWRRDRCLSAQCQQMTLTRYGNGGPHAQLCVQSKHGEYTPQLTWAGTPERQQIIDFYRSCVTRRRALPTILPTTVLFVSPLGQVPVPSAGMLQPANASSDVEGQSLSALPAQLDVCLFCYCKRVVDLNSQISNSALYFWVPKKQLNRPRITCPPCQSVIQNPFEFLAQRSTSR